MNELPISVTQTIAAPTVGGRYQFLSTLDIIETFKQRGWELIKTRTPNVRNPDARAFCKHVLEFEHNEYSNLLNVGEEKLRIRVLNSHNGKSSLQIGFGVFRLVCSNGLVVSKSTLGEFRLRHFEASKLALDGLIVNLLTYATEVNSSIESFKATKLTDMQAFEFAIQARQLLKQLQPSQEFNINDLLKIRRPDDAGSSLWQIFNRIQENAIKRGFDTTNVNTGKSRRSREVKSIDVSNRINTELWSIAETLKAA